MSVSDLMAGLMVIFLFVAIALMRHALAQRDKIREVAVSYQQTQVAIYNALMEEFRDDLKAWNADISEETLSFDFNSPDVLFDVGETRLREQFKLILNDFFPRFLAVLSKYKDSIEEVRIEGHTSSIWNRNTPPTEAYFKNMRLSQGRTRAVLEYVYLLPSVEPERDWVKRRVAAVGYSSSRAVLQEDGTEDRERSRRVSFRVITNAETQIRKILME